MVPLPCSLLFKWQYFLHSSSLSDWNLKIELINSFILKCKYLVSIHIVILSRDKTLNQKNKSLEWNFREMEEEPARKYFVLLVTHL